MIESMACGTPVIATRYGAVPEVIEDGRAGSSSTTSATCPAALERADALDPRECRALGGGALFAGSDGRRLRARLPGSDGLERGIEGRRAAADGLLSAAT